MLLPLSNEGELIVFLVMNPFTPKVINSFTPSSDQDRTSL